MRHFLTCFALTLALCGPALAADEMKEAPMQLPIVSKGIYAIRPFRNATFAAASSMLLPGGGQVYNDDIGKFIAVIAGLGVPAWIYYTNPDSTVRLLSGVGFGLVWVWSVGDAYLSATTYNMALERQALP